MKNVLQVSVININVLLVVTYLGPNTVFLYQQSTEQNYIS